MCRTISVLIGSLLLATLALAQPPEILWINTFGEAAYERSYCVQQTQGGGFILAGYKWDIMASDTCMGYLIKTDAEGNEEWNHQYPGDYEQELFHVMQTEEGGYIATGWAYSGPLNVFYVYVVKTDEFGDIEWERWYEEGTCGKTIGEIESVGYYILGYSYSPATSSDFCLITIDQNGDVLWSQSYGTTEIEYCKGGLMTDDGGYVLAGLRDLSGPQDDIYIIRTNENGELLWEKTYGGDARDKAHAVCQSDDGGFVICGMSESYGTSGYDCFLLKTDASGDSLWLLTGGPLSMSGSSVQQTNDGGYIVSGHGFPEGAVHTDVFIQKSDADGNEEYQMFIDNCSSDYGKCIRQLDDGGFIVSGSTYSYLTNSADVLLIRLDAENVLPVTIAVSPYNPPIQIPATGGSFDFNVSLTNNEATSQTFDAWIMVTLPNSTPYGPVLGPVNLTLPGGSSIDRDRTQAVPAGAPAGVYSYNAYVGQYPGVIWSEDSFNFEKLTDGDGAVIYDWLSFGEEFGDIGGGSTPALQEDFVLLGAYPNPFNPSTTISFTLPEATKVNLSIYDVSGRMVTELVDGWRTAGTHEVNFDGSNLASGIYLYQLEVSESGPEGGLCSTTPTTMTGKMVLMK